MTNSGMPHTPTEDTPTPLGGYEKPEIATKPKDTKSVPLRQRIVNKILDFLGMEAFDDSQYISRERVEAVEKKLDDFAQTLKSFVEQQCPICGRIFVTYPYGGGYYHATEGHMAICSSVCLGEYQRRQAGGTDLITEGLSQDTVTPSRPVEHKKQELERDGNG